MPAPTTPADLLDLKMMPAWVNEPAQTNDYSHYEGEEEQSFRRDNRGPQRGREQRSPRGPKPIGRREERRDDRRRPEQRRPDQRREQRPPERREPREAAVALPRVTVRFVPRPGAFESVIAQIKTESVAYSVFALARLFLEKPERYDVRLTAEDGGVLYQLGEHGPVSGDQRILESGAFTALRDQYYTVEQTQSDPIKGNFTNVARDRASGTLLGPTNHHNYQPQLRALYEQRYSRRMSFQDFQRQIEIVSDPAVVEQWKEEARSVTTYAAKETEPPLTFHSLAETERHFRQTHLPTLLRSAQEVTISGVVSRQLSDRALGRFIEENWTAEIRSPAKMMQELSAGLRQAGLNIFRHRRGMLYVSPIRTRVFAHDWAKVSPTIHAILEKLTQAAGSSRKQLAEQFTPAEADATEQERIKRTLASDLRWLINEGYLIEFNDGTLDLPRAKAPASAGGQPAAGAQAGEQPQAAAPVDEPSGAPAPDAKGEEASAATEAQAVSSAGEVTPTAGEAISTAGEVIAAAGEVILTAGEVVPPAAEVVPVAVEAIPPTAQVVATGGEVVPPDGEVSPTAGEVASDTESAQSEPLEQLDESEGGISVEQRTERSGQENAG